MNKHVNFWIGFLTAIVVAIPVAFGIMGMSEDGIKNIPAFLFGAICVLVVLLIFFLFFKDRVFDRLFRVSQSSLEVIVGDAVRLFASIGSPQSKDIESSAKNLSLHMLQWYSWTNFYRWIINTCIVLLLAFAGFAGTMLLFEQNKKIEEQNLKIGEQTTQLKRQNENLSAQTSQLEAQSNAIISQTDIMNKQTNKQTYSMVNILYLRCKHFQLFERH